MANSEEHPYVLLEINEALTMPNGMDNEGLEDFKKYARHVFPVARDFDLQVELNFLSKLRPGTTVRAFLLQDGAEKCSKSVDEIRTAWADWKAGYKACWQRQQQMVHNKRRPTSKIEKRVH